MTSNRFFFKDDSSSSEESSDGEQPVQIQPHKGGTSRSAAKPYVFLPCYFFS